LELWDLGIYLEDRDHLKDGDTSALVRPLDRSLVEARAERDASALAKEKAKAEREAAKMEQERALREKAKVSPSDMFRTPEYTAWDDDGIPLKDAKGEEVTKSKRKKLVKEWERQKKIHDEYSQTAGS